jgi:ribosomal protein S12 methylthiotransferase accessory factor YcaO
MISLAPVRYRGVFAKDSGPIRSVVLSETNLLGRPLFQANAHLEPSLVPTKQVNGMFGNADGTGTHASPQVARHMAISEALERWAYWTVSTGPEADRYGFAVDRTSTGMAAFPCLFKRSARRLAYLEALERWALASWWLGRLDAALVTSPIPGVSVVRISHGRPDEVVVAFRRSPGGHVSYGYAAGSSFNKAVLRAAIEMARNEFVLAFAKVSSAVTAPLTAFERRCQYFSSQEGHDEFLHRVFGRRAGRAAEWAVLFDGEIPGPWDHFATVWRVVPAMPEGYASEQVRFFAW